jgi:hypothetical protein
MFPVLTPSRASCRAVRTGLRRVGIDQVDDLSIDHNVLDTPAAIAGTIFTALFMRANSYQAVYSATMWQWFSNFLLWALVNHV